MKYTLALVIILFYSCSHTITISPNLSSIKNDSKIIDKKVAFYIPLSERDKEVRESSGTGDTIVYFPYRDLESSIHKVLFEVFKNVERLESFPSGTLVKERGYSYVFLPEITTKSQNDSILFWPPTQFTIKLTVNVINEESKIIWSKEFEQGMQGRGKGLALISLGRKDIQCALIAKLIQTNHLLICLSMMVINLMENQDGKKLAKRDLMEFQGSNL